MTNNFSSALNPLSFLVENNSPSRSQTLLELFLLKLFFLGQRHNSLKNISFEKLASLQRDLLSLTKEANKCNMESPDDPTALFLYNTETFNIWIMTLLGFNGQAVPQKEALSMCDSSFQKADELSSKRSFIYPNLDSIQKQNIIEKQSWLDEPDSKEYLFLLSKYQILARNPFIASLLSIIENLKITSIELSKLIEKSYFSDLHLLKFLTEEMKININAFGKDGLTLLMLACRENAIHIVKYLLNCPDIEPNITRVGNGSTALHIACAEGNPETVKLLLSHPKTDINFSMKGHKWGILDRFNGSPLVIALININFDIVEFFLSDGRLKLKDSSELLMLLATPYVDQNLQLKHLKMLLRRGADFKLDLKIGHFDLKTHALNFITCSKLNPFIEEFLIPQFFPKEKLIIHSEDDVELIKDCIINPSMFNSIEFSKRFNITLEPKVTCSLFKCEKGYLQEYLFQIAAAYTLELINSKLTKQLH